MQDKDLFDENGDSSEFQSGLSLDDGSGLRVVSAKFIKAEKFDWALFEGYDKLRVLTYSASVKTIVRMLDKYSFTNFECVFGYLGVLRDIKDILSFQKVAAGDTRAAIMGLKDDRHAHILGKVHEGQAHFYVLRKYIAHAKLYLLSKTEGETRVIIGSANLSERAFSGTQSETLVKFDNDEKAWRHYNQMFDKIIGDSSDEISLSEDRITFADIEILETPVMNETPSTMIIDSPVTEEIELAAPMQIACVEKVSALISPLISAAIPPIRGGKQRITQETRRDISRIRLVKTAEEANNPYFSFDRVNNSAILSGEVFPLESNFDSVKTDANLLLGFFKNYENAFEGDVPRMQRDYFMFMAWMYFHRLWVTCVP